MYKIGVIGDRESVLGFKAVGLTVFSCDSQEEADAAFRETTAGDYAIIYIPEPFDKGMMAEAGEYVDKRLPAIIPIPDKDGSLGIGMESVKKAVERAVGADILFGGE